MNPVPLPENNRYLVYRNGQIYDSSPMRGKPRFISQNKVEGYYTVNIANATGGRTTRWLHRIIAECFVENKCGGHLVRHLNDIRDDNRIENLSWGNYVDNWDDRKANGNGSGVQGKDNVQSKVTEDDVLDIRILFKMGASQRSIGSAFGLCQQQIQRICSGQRWTHIKECL